MTISKLTLGLSAIIAATPALAHPGHGAAGGHVHWEFVAAAFVFAGACGVAFWRRKAAVRRK
ncbi:MAG: hypothetical protein AAGF86_05375 [Pseudomonadota bacterium]